MGNIRIRLGLCAFFFYGAVVTGQTTTGEILGDKFSDLINSESNYMRALGEARLNWAISQHQLAQAEYLHTLSENNRLRTIYLSLFVERLRYDFYHLKKREAVFRNKMKKVEAWSRSLAVLNTGRTSQHVFGALRGLKMHAVDISLFLPGERTAVPELPAADFIPNKVGKDAVPFPAGNVAKLMRFIEVNNFSLEPGGEAYFAVLTYIADIEKAAEEKALAIERHMQELEDGKLDIWKPPAAEWLPAYNNVNGVSTPGGVSGARNGIVVTF